MVHLSFMLLFGEFVWPGVTFVDLPPTLNRGVETLDVSDGGLYWGLGSGEVILTDLASSRGTELRRAGDDGARSVLGAVGQYVLVMLEDVPVKRHFRVTATSERDGSTTSIVDVSEWPSRFVRFGEGACWAEGHVIACFDPGTRSVKRFERAASVLGLASDGERLCWIEDDAVHCRRGTTSDELAWRPGVALVDLAISSGRMVGITVWRKLVERQPDGGAAPISTEDDVSRVWIVPCGLLYSDRLGLQWTGPGSGPHLLAGAESPRALTFMQENPLYDVVFYDTLSRGIVRQSISAPACRLAVSGR